MSRCRSQSILLIVVHLQALLATNVGKIPDLIDCMLNFIVHWGLKIKAEVLRLCYITRVSPPTLCCVARAQQPLLLLCFQIFELLNNQNGSTMPNVLEDCFCFLEHSFLEIQKVVNVQGVWYLWLKSFCTCHLRQTIGQIPFLDYCLKVLQIYKFEVPKLLPPILERANNNVVGDQSKLDFILSLDLAVMCALVKTDWIASLLDLPFRSGYHVLWQHQNVKSLPLIRWPQNIIHDGLLHWAFVRKLKFFVQILDVLFEVFLKELWDQFQCV